MMEGEQEGGARLAIALKPAEVLGLEQKARDHLRGLLWFESGRLHRVGLALTFLAGLGGANYWSNQSVGQAATAAGVGCAMALALELLATWFLKRRAAASSKAAFG